MSARIRAHIRANIIGYVALFFALSTGSAVALNGSNTVFTDDIVNDQVYSADVRNDTLGGGGLAAVDLRPNSVGQSEIAAGGVAASEVLNGSLGTAEFGTLPAARATNTTAESVPNATGGTDLTLDTERFDTAGMHSTSSNTERMTAPIDGTYLITGNVSWAGNTTGSRQTSIFRNGTTKIVNDNGNGEAGGPDQVVATVTRLAAGDFVTLRAGQDSGGALSVNATFGSQEYTPELAIAWIGP